MKVQLLRSITSIQRALPGDEKLRSTRRDEIYSSIEDYDFNLGVAISELPYTCAVWELGEFDDFETPEDAQIAILNRLLRTADATLDTTTSPISIEFPYGLIFTIIDNENGRNIRDAILGILPFKLIGKGISTRTNNPLETWGLFPDPTV